MSDYRYPWPASALTRDEMALLYFARENSNPRIPITQLIAEAVRAQYGHLANLSFSAPQPRSPHAQTPPEAPSSQTAAA